MLGSGPSTYFEYIRGTFYDSMGGFLDISIPYYGSNSGRTTTIVPIIPIVSASRFTACHQEQKKYSTSKRKKKIKEKREAKIK
jgi:hypothetical protein